MNPARTDRSRRRFCTTAVAAVVCTLGALRAPAQEVGSDHGRVSPHVPVPDVRVRAADGTSQGLASLLRGRATALHLMFTSCPTLCPIEAAIFQRVQLLVPDQVEHGIQLLSLSIDPENDSPAALKAWLDKFRARAGWIAVAPAPKDLGVLLELFGQGRNAIENHATQVNIINRKGELIWRTPELPSGDSIADILGKV